VACLHKNTGTVISLQLNRAVLQACRGVSVL